MKKIQIELPTYWRVQGSVEDVYDVITHPLEFPRWWPQVYLDAKQLEPGDDRGIGRIVQVKTKGRLPYTMTWRAQSVKSEKPTLLALRSEGDLQGEGVWHFKQVGSWVEIFYDWKVIPNKKWMRLFASILVPIFRANHYWAMSQGEKCLAKELLRRSRIKS